MISCALLLLGLMWLPELTCPQVILLYWCWIKLSIFEDNKGIKDRLGHNQNNSMIWSSASSAVLKWPKISKISIDGRALLRRPVFNGCPFRCHFFVSSLVEQMWNKFSYCALWSSPAFDLRSRTVRKFLSLNRYRCTSPNQITSSQSNEQIIV